MAGTVFHTCNVCEAMCGMALTVGDGNIIKVRPDPEDVLSHGHICPKGPAMVEVLQDPDRLRQPMRRTAGGWEPVPWPEALAEATRRIHDIQREHGRDAVGLYIGNPTSHNHGTALFVQLFARALGTHNKFDANSQDANPKIFACMQMYGDWTSVTVPDVDRTDYLLMLGANPAASNGSLMTLGDTRRRLRSIRERGGRLVLIDPRRTETAAWADEHHFIRPGGDAALLLAMINVLFAESRIDEGALALTTRGLDQLRTLAAEYAPERVENVVGIEAEVIRRLAREFAGARHAVAYGRIGTCQNAFGPIASWLIEALNVLCGQFDVEGGAMFATPAIDLGPLARKLMPSRWNRWRSRVRQLPELSGLLPASVIAEEMETPGQGQIRAFITVAGNPVLSTANGERLARALTRLDFGLAIDFYINETTRHADLVLPPTHALEQAHYDLLFHSVAVRNTVIYEGRSRVKGQGRLDPGEGKGGRPGAMPMRWLKTESSIRARSSWCDSGQAAQSN